MTVGFSGTVGWIGNDSSMKYSGGLVDGVTVAVGTIDIWLDF